MTSRKAGVGLLAVAMLIPRCARTEGPPSEYQLKAAFLYNFAKFVEWPPTPEEPREPLAICVCGKDPFGGALERVMEGKTVNDRPIVIRRTNDMAVARSCQVLFVSSSETARMGEIVKALHDASVLSVSDAEHFCRWGGVIAFVMQGQRVRFHINAGAAAAASLKISSKLLQLAVAIPGDKDGQ